MKTLTILLIAMLVSTLTFAQEDRKLEEIKVTPPQFMGNYLAPDLVSVQNNAMFNEYLKDYLKESAQAFIGAVQGTEVVRFEVSPDGKLADFKVINSISSQVDHAMYEILKTTCGMWRPGYNNGDPVAMEKEISVVFKMVNTADFDNLATKYLKKGTEDLFINENPQKALRHLNQGIKYRPNEDCLLVCRGICKYELGDKVGAEADWARMIQHGGVSDDAKEMAVKFIDLKGYTALTTFLEKE